ncbi:MAG: ferrous iron transport protein B, partial [Prevotella sp.]|nr:ferrous iron transport protein B [Prevotella sp.]
MRLSELKTGEKAIIVKVLGHGGFRKRIVEMGFIDGKEVEVLLNAPLQDPVKYKIMGYELSLRHSEAAMIEVMSEEEARKIHEEQKSETTPEDVSHVEDNCDDLLYKVATQKSKTINVALVGNPNSGKTSLFNFASGAHERVGNYSGVTVDAKVGHVNRNGYRFDLVDLPGTYSLSAYSPEELYVRKHIIDKTPDVIINVIDSNNLERNLYLTTQLIDMNIKTVGALNMFDEVEARGDKLDCDKLGELFGMPMIPTVFKTGRGVDELFEAVIAVYEGDNEGGKYQTRHIHLNHGKYIEPAIDEVKEKIQINEQIRYKYSTRFLSIKMLERDSKIEELIKTLPNGDEIIATRDRVAEEILRETKEDSETAIMNAKYGIINGALQESGCEEGKKTDTYHITHVLDALVTNKYAGFPVFILFMYIMFEVTFSLGQYPMDWIDAGVGALSDFLEATMPEGILKAMVIDGAIAGVGAVIGFLPQIIILYFFISFMEDSGYMARAAFIMDKLMHKMGLHGKSFIPLVMGFGCNVPAVMATRTIENRRNRLVTILILPLMSCSARLPVY